MGLAMWHVRRRIEAHTLDDGIDDSLLVFTCAPRGQVSRDGLIDLDQARLLVDDMKLVLINQLMITGTQFSDVFTIPSAGLEVGCPDTVDAVSGPDEITVVPKDVRGCLTRAMLLSGRVGQTGKRG